MSVAGEREEVKYTETQLETLVSDGVARETAALTEVNEELRSQVDTLTSEKAELETTVTTLETERDTERAAKEAAIQEFADFKAEQEEAAAQAALRDDRVKAFKEAAGALHGEDYYTEERAEKWAAMPEDIFTDTLETVSAAAEAAGKKDGEPAKGADGKETARETAAFGGGGKPTSKAADGQSTARRFLSAGGRIPANI